MRATFQKLSKSLAKNQVSLQEFQEYLYYCEKSPYQKLTSRLKQQKIKLKQYQEYLENNALDSAVSVKKTLSPEIQKIEKISFKLLAENKIELSELNAILRETPLNLSLRNFLQQLLKRRKIQIETFIEWLQKDWLNEETLATPYHLIKQDSKVEIEIRSLTDLKTIGPYKVLEKLGSGGMGTVYKVYHIHLKQFFALKLLNQKALRNSDTLKRFFREIRIMAKLSHPGIVQIIDSGEFEEQPYLAMECIHGESLDQWMQQKHSLRNGLILLKKCLEALHYAHEQKIIHRDLKPANILVTTQGEPKLTDFGLAKETQSSPFSHKLTQSGALLGTPHYMSPEQALGKVSEVGVASDIFSLGATLYHLLTKKRPFESAELMVLVYKIAQVDPIPPAEINPDIHPDLETILLKALEKEPHHRYASALEFAQDLNNFLEGYPILAKPPNYFDQFLKWVRRHRKNVIFFSLLLLMFSIFSVTLIWFRYQENQKEIQALFTQIQQTKKAAAQLTSHHFAERTQKISLLLHRLNKLNELLNLKPKNLEIEQAIWENGKELVELSCQSESYKLANYIAQKMYKLSFLETDKLLQLFKKIKQRRTKKLAKHRKRLEELMLFLKSSSPSSAKKRDIISEISRMPENEICQKLIEVLEEGKEYFLNFDQFDPVQVTYYEILVIALGRSENELAGKPLQHCLITFAEQLGPIPEHQRNLTKLDFMVYVAQAIGNLKQQKYTKNFEKARIKMGYTSLFKYRTDRFYKKLVLLSPPKEGQLKEVQDYLDRGKVNEVRGDFQAALRDYTQAIRLAPKSSVAYSHRGFVKRVLKDLTGALEDFNRSIFLAPNEGVSYSNRGSVYHNLKQYKKAILDYNRAIQLSPQLAYVYGNRGSAKVALGDLKGALVDFKQAARLNPHSAEARYNLGNIKQALGDFKGSIHDFNETIRLNPQYWSAYTNRGNVKVSIGDLKGALSDFDQVVRLNPRSDSAYLNRGNVKQQLGDLQGSILDYNEAIRILPNETLAYINRGEAKQQLGKLRAAILDYDQAIQLNPKSVDAYLNRSSAKALLKDYLGSISDYNQVLKIDPLFSEIYFRRGILFFALGKTAAAKIDFQKYLKLTNNSKDPMVKEKQGQVFKFFPHLKK